MEGPHMPLGTLATLFSPIVTRVGFDASRIVGENPSSLRLVLVALATMAVYTAYHRGPRGGE